MKKFNWTKESLMFLLAIAAIFLFTSYPAKADSTSTNNFMSVTSFNQIKYLLGEWVGEGGGDPGQGVGGFSFNMDLQGKIMTRKNYAEYPSTKDKPAYRHDDFMVLYQENTSSPMKAIYWDNEGHVINYAIEISSDQKSIIFTSDKSANTPQFRLTYVKSDDKNIGIVFEIAPPNMPDEFSRYLEASAHRK